MFQNNLGYLFESRLDANGKAGVMESFKVNFKNGLQRVSVILAVDSNGNIVIPAYNDISLGFKPLSAKCTSKGDVAQFVRSNKPYFGKLGEFSLIASGNIIYDNETKEVVSTEELAFYVPKTVSNKVDGFTDKNGNYLPVIICDKLSTSKGLNNLEVKQLTYDAYLKTFLSNLDAKAAEDRNTFLCSIILKE